MSKQTHRQAAAGTICAARYHQHLRQHALEGGTVPATLLKESTPPVLAMFRVCRVVAYALVLALMVDGSHATAQKIIRRTWRAGRVRAGGRRLMCGSCGNQGCGSGYNTGTNPCSSCGADEYEVSACTSTQSTQCNTCSSLPSCGSGSYRSGCGGDSQGTCETCGSCPPGQYRSGCSGLHAGASSSSGCYLEEYLCMWLENVSH